MACPDFRQPAPPRAPPRTMSNEDGSGNLESLRNIPLDDLMELRLAITGYRVHGLHRTQKSFVARLLNPIISTGGSFGSAVEDIVDAVNRLEVTGVFNGVDAYLDRTSSTTGEVVFTVNEKNSLQLNAGTSVRANERHDSSVELAAIWRNVTGRMDILRATLAAGAPGSNLTQMFSSKSLDDADQATGLIYRAPYALGIQTEATAKLHRYTRHWPASHFCERTNEASMGVSHEYLGELELGAAWREVCNIAPEASMLLRDEAGHHWKASVRHRFVLDRRDDEMAPTSGWRLGTDVEIAGIAGMGDAKFRKAEADFQAHFPIGTSGISLSGIARVGALGARGSGGSVPICDRFFLGGPTALRGFTFRGVGPRESGTSLGGHAFYTLSAFVSVPTPERSPLAVFFNGRAHAFIQAGDVGDVKDVAKVLNKPSRIRESYKALRDNARITTGVGIAGVTSFGRVELNWCHVLAKADSDIVGSSVQFNLSKEFL